MIFGKLLKKIQDLKAADQKKDMSQDAVQPAISSEFSGDSAPRTLLAAKKTKTDKRNRTLINSNRKRRSKRVVHTKRSFHRQRRRPIQEQVRVYDVIERPVITEKAANQSENGVYTFLVRSWANKHSVADAVEVLYGVRPVKVRIVKRPAKRKRVRVQGREREYGMTAEKKKAYIFLREGDTIKLT